MTNKDAFKIVDVFAGPGGLGEGFSALGFDTGKSPFKLAVSIEKDASAHSTLMLRSFFRQFSPDNIPEEYWSYVKGDISKIELFDLYPDQLKAAALEAQCIELGKIHETTRPECCDYLGARVDGRKQKSTGRNM